MTHAVRKIPRSLLVAVALATAACSPAPAAPAGAAALAPVTVRTAPVATAPAPRIVRATGSFRADDEVTLAAEVPGRVVAVTREVGAPVATGELLARIDATDAELELTERRRALAESLARLGLTTLPEGEPDFAALPAIERARLEAANAKAKFDRAKTLHERVPPLISDQDFEDLRTAWSVAESAERVALLAAQAQLAEARTRAAQIAVAERRIALCAHAAPPARDGTTAARFLVAERLVTVGDFVRAGDALYRLVDADPLLLVASVPERTAAGVEVGRPVTIAVAGASAPVRATVTRLRPEVDARSRSLVVEIVVPNADGRLFAGAFATVEIDTGTDPSVVVVPESAVRTFAGVRKVFLAVEGKAVEKIVATGRRLGASLEVLSGVKAGDVVVLEPPPNLVAGVPLVTDGAAGGTK